eukprot:CAMPEP_0170171536 /NCGR_PEP_ID=MMETSP0040_2-20121228/4699_1 /TAXON_ID=641309 /ORGANISM="Lotharella oceanica, Strain CCMP622" /LENGTH=389 /DNA_ID=CAMNT_0010411653 /DNA_START=307 /DNA_END=1476 /DNA_ORIENTATION=-
MMLAHVFRGISKRPKLMRVPLPQILAPTDVIVRVNKTTICGTDLHIQGGHVPTCHPGTVLGHEGTGHVVAAGPKVKNLKPGDHVVVNCITACGHCEQCLHQRHAQCVDGGWQLGNTIHGMQAEYARIPHADFSAVKLPEAVSKDPALEEACAMASDVLPTSFEIGLRAGDFRTSGSIAVAGVGPIGLGAITSAVAQIRPLTSGDTKKARIFAIDMNEHRLEVARSLGATDTVNNSRGDAVEQIMEATEGKGVDFVVECIGTPSGWDLCQNIVADGGEVTILGVHGHPGSINLQTLWQKNVSIHTGNVHGYTMQAFVEKIVSGAIDASKLISHNAYGLEDIEEAYEFFGNANATHSLKVILTNNLINKAAEFPCSFDGSVADANRMTITS